LWAEKKETSRRLVLLTARRVPDVIFFLPARRVPDKQWLELYVRFPTCRHFPTCNVSVRYLDNAHAHKTRFKCEFYHLFNR